MGACSLGKKYIIGGCVLLQLFMFVVVVNVVAEPRLQSISTTTFHDTLTGKMWQAERSSRIKDAGKAEDVVAALNAGEFSDWRFPTKEELFELFCLPKAMWCWCRMTRRLLRHARAAGHSTAI